MASTDAMTPAALGGQISLPRYDPLREDGRQRVRWTTTLLSIGLHLALLAIFWDAIIGAVLEEETVVKVRVIEPEPQRQQPKLRRKVMAHRVVDSRVTQRKQIVQPQVVEVSPIRRFDSAQKVEVRKTQVLEAPKQIKQTQVTTRRVDVFSERPVAQPKLIPKVTSAQVTRVEAAKPTSGPRKLEAASPTINARAADVTAPIVARGKIANNAIEGDVTGARVADVEVGDSSALLDGVGDTGSLIGEEKDCNTDPVCREYLEQIRRRVYARWAVPMELGGGQVTLRFRLDRGGSVHDVMAVAMTNQELGDTASRAFQHASPFPPPPKSIHYIVNKRMRLIFTTNVSER